MLCKLGYQLEQTWRAQCAHIPARPASQPITAQEQAMFAQQRARDDYRRALAAYKAHRAGCAECQSLLPSPSVSYATKGDMQPEMTCRQDATR
jgi:hypothetical protein